MYKISIKLAGLVCYLALLGMLYGFDWLQLLEPKSLLAILLGTVILTASQYRKGSSKADMAASLKWNLLFAGFLTTLLSVLSAMSSPNITSMTGRKLAGHLLPIVYSSILYLVSMVFYKDEKKETGALPYPVSVVDHSHLLDAAVAERVFKAYALTGRECHVALKLLEDTPNKEIAQQLYITEATVKKHVQNIYQKFQVSDRNSFRKSYLSKAVTAVPVELGDGKGI